MKFKIGLDIDGVLRDFSGMLDRVYSRSYPDHIVPEIGGWDLHKSYPIGDDIYRFAFEEHGDEIMSRADAYQGARWFVNEILGRGHRVVLVTTQPENLRIPTLVWLLRNGLADLQICFLSDKSLARVDVLLDDHTKNLASVAEAETLPVAFDRPWNTDWPGMRVHSYRDFLYQLDSCGLEEAWHQRKSSWLKTDKPSDSPSPYAYTVVTADSPTTSISK